MRALGIGEDLILTTRETRRVTESVMRALAQIDSPARAP
jgi:hypothetical protein